MFKKINTRGRKREARRWIEESNRQRLRIVFGDGPPRAGVDSQGRTFTERSRVGGLASAELFEQLRVHDRVLYEAVVEIMWAEAAKVASMTPEQFRARRLRRFAKYQRERPAWWSTRPPR